MHADIDVKTFLSNTLEDLTRETAGCNCGCTHRPTLDGLVVVATINGGPFIYAADGENSGVADLLARAVDQLRGPKSLAV